MHQTKITITKEEMDVINDTAFLITKSTVLQKMKLLLQQLQDEITFTAKNYNLPVELFKIHGKISSGENYKGLPFLILDYPRVFQKEDVFAFRSMFWWGNYFLFTLHLQGKFLEKYQALLIENLKGKANKGIFISTGDSPWVHHLEEGNFTEYSLTTIVPQQPPFIKLARKLELNDWEKLPVFGKESFMIFLRLLGADKMS